MKLFEILRSETNKQLLNAFSNAIEFIFDIKNYIVSIYICVEVLNILRYKVSNMQSTLNELILILAEFKNVHERNKNRICLKH